MTLRVHLMGTVAAQVDLSEVKLGGPRQSVVLTALALEAGRTVSTDRLIDLVWDDRPPASSRRTLQSYVSSLRSRLGNSAALGREGHGYVLDIGRHQVDLLDFEDAAAAALRTISTDPAKAATELADLASRWSEPMGGMPSSAGVEAMLAPFVELHLQVVEGLATAQIDSGQAGPAVRSLEELVRKHPTREDLWLQLARGLCELDRRDMALDAFQRAREALREQLGVDLGPRLASLEADVLAGVRVRPIAPTSASYQTVGATLPVRPTRLIGRDADVARIHQLLDSHRLVTITAVGGSGKTHLATEVAQQERAGRPGGVWFIDLTTVRKLDDVSSAIASAIDLQLTVGDATKQVLSYLAGKRALLVLDNCEHVIEACAQFCQAFLAAPDSAVILSTSREALAVNGEQLIHLGPLTTAAATASGDASDSPAVQLFMERAISLDAGLKMTPDNARLILTLCERLDGLPLAIELAAARMTVLNLAELIDGLDDRFDLLSGGRPGQRSRTLEATLDWSYQLLEPAQQQVFRKLGPFVGGFDVDAVAAVIGSARFVALNLIEALVAKSLVVRVGGERVSRFGLLETVKAYAEEQLAKAGETSEARDSHAEYFHRIAMVRGRTLSADARIGSQLRFDKSNVAAAVDWLASDGQWVSAVELFIGSLAVFENHGHAAEAKALFDRCEQPIEEIDSLLADQLRASIILSIIVLDDVPALKKLAQTMRSSADAACRSCGCGLLAFALRVSAPQEAENYRAEATRNLEQAEREQPGLNTDIARGLFQYVLAIGYGLAGEVEAALAAYADMPDLVSRHGHMSATLNTALSSAAVCDLLVGNPSSAMDRLAQLSDVGYAYGELNEIRALISFSLDDLEKAREHVRRLAAEAATGRLSRQCNDAVLLLAELSAAEGNRERALELLPVMGLGRSPGTVMFARNLAERLGIADQHAAYELTADDPNTWAEHGVHHAATAMKMLHAEMARRGWD